MQLEVEMAARGQPSPIPRPQVPAQRIPSAVVIGNDDPPKMYVCTVCPDLGRLFAQQYIEHVISTHTGQKEVCAICASQPNGDPNLRSEDLGAHTELRHLDEEETRRAIAESLQDH